MTYPGEPMNATDVLEAVRTPSLRGYIVDHSIPMMGLDVPLVTALPLAPKDRMEVNWVLDAANNTVARMLWRASKNAWVQVGQLPTVTALPTVPAGVTAMEVYYVADATNSVVWHLRYRSASASTYKWEFVGGGPMRAENAGADMTTTSTTYVDLSTVGPTVTVPLAGDYRIMAGCPSAYHGTSTGLIYMAIKNGATATSDANGTVGQTFAAGGFVNLPTFETAMTVAAASTVVKAQYKTPSGTATINITGAGTMQKAWMTVTPVRVI